jgi:hypothetical protein
MRFKVIFSDDETLNIDAETPNAAFKEAQTKNGVGRFVTRICARGNSSHIYYVNGEFVDPYAEASRILGEVDLQIIIKRIRPSFSRLDTSRDVKFDGIYYTMKSVGNGPGSFITDIRDYNNHAVVLRRVITSVTIQDFVPVVHEFKDMVCIHCEGDLFEIENPNGECGGK